MKKLCLTILTVALLPTAASWSAEVIYPGSIDLACSYTVSDLNPRVGDTIRITRTVKNNESFSISGLYIGDNLPESFQVISDDIRLNSTPVPAGFEADPVNTLKADFVPYHWTIDDPNSPAFSTILSPGDSLYLAVDLICSEAGDFLLDQHSSVGYGNSTPFFVLADQPINIIVSIATDVDDETELPGTFLTSTAYPNPFNAVTSIAFSLGHTENLRLEIYDLLGRMVHERTIRAQSNHGTVSWDASDVGSGIYLYRLSSKEHTTVGKLVLLK